MITHSPSFRACSATFSTLAASASPRRTGSWPSTRRKGPISFTSNADDLIMNAGYRPASCTNSDMAGQSAYDRWLAATSMPPSRGKCW